MRRATTLLATIALSVALLSVPATAGPGPDGFGTDWDDPRTAVKPIETPGTPSCEVTIADHDFADSDRVEAEYHPPKGCGEDWAAVVLRLEGSVSGDQSGRVARLTIGGVPVFAGSTPRPGPNGTGWSRERDLSGYAALLADDHDAVVSLDEPARTADSGELDLKLSLTFYATDADHPAASGADAVLPLRDKHTDGPKLSGKLRTPRNTERLLADVYATAAEGCERDWYRTVTPDNGYRCEHRDGPYREVRVYLDGELAGLAAPYPHVAADGWSNPYLWSPLPAPRSFDLRPVTVDLTPYLGQLNDGGRHEVRVEVGGAAADSTAWSTPVAFRAWRDAGSAVVRGGLLDAATTGPVNDGAPAKAADGARTLTVEAHHSHTATGWLATSHGNLLTTVERDLGLDSRHTWTPDTDAESLAVAVTDVETRSVVTGEGTATRRVVDRGFGVDGSTAVTAAGEIDSHVELSDAVTVTTTDSVGDRDVRRVSDTYTGEAAFHPDAGRYDPTATGSGRHRFRAVGGGDCYDRTVSSRNGRITGTVDRCGSAKS